MLKALIVPLYPNATQCDYFKQSFDATRFVWNKVREYSVALHQKYGLFLSYYDMKKELVFLKEIYPFLCEANSQSLQKVCWYYDLARKAAFKRMAENKKRPKAFTQPIGLPRFKSRKHSKQSFTNPQNCEIDIENGLIHIPKCKNIKAVFPRTVEGKIKEVTISLQLDGRYYAAICYDDGLTIPAKQPVTSLKQVCGIDLGLTDVFAFSDGTKSGNPRHIKQTANQLAIAQRILARAKLGSTSRERKRLAVNRLYQRIANQRKDYTHKITTQLVQSDYVAFGVERLAVKNLMKNHKLAKSIADVAWYEIKRQLQYKSEWVGKTVIESDRFFASTQCCSECGQQGDKQPLSVRAWQCSHCGTQHDRDVNAAKNLQCYAGKVLGLIPQHSTLKQVKKKAVGTTVV